MPTPDWLQCGRFRLSGRRALVMGVLNVTPDSFSDGGRHATTQAAIDHAGRLIDEGADLIDIGGESTRPGSTPVPPDEEAARVLPVLRALRDAGVPISVDTRRPGLMRAALDEGADMINDIEGFRAPGAIDAVRGSACAVVAMHMQGEPATMQQAPAYGDVVAEVRDFLRERLGALRAAGIADDRIVLDPGFGFGKTFDHNVALMRALPELAALGAPLLVGVSRKGMVGKLTGRAPADRVAGSVAAALAAVARGARIVRVHDVAATRDALTVWAAI